MVKNVELKYELHALEQNSKKRFLYKLFSLMISIKAMAIGTLNIDRKIFKLKQIQVF